MYLYRIATHCGAVKLNSTANVSSQPFHKIGIGKWTSVNSSRSSVKMGKILTSLLPPLKFSYAALNPTVRIDRMADIRFMVPMPVDGSINALNQPDDLVSNTCTIKLSRSIRSFLRMCEPLHVLKRYTNTSPKIQYVVNFRPSRVFSSVLRETR